MVLVTGEKGPTGGHTSFTVAASPVSEALPAAQAKIATIEFGFKGASTIHDGEVVGFEDGGFLVHMDFAFPVKSKTAAAKVVTALKSGKEKGVQKLIAGAPVAFSARSRQVPTSRRRSRRGPAGTSRCASWKRRTAVRTRGWAWSA